MNHWPEIIENHLTLNFVVYCLLQALPNLQLSLQSFNQDQIKCHQEPLKGSLSTSETPSRNDLKPQTHPKDFCRVHMEPSEPL